MILGAGHELQGMESQTIRDMSNPLPEERWCIAKTELDDMFSVNDGKRLFE
jgi:hypothetical protein